MTISYWCDSNRSRSIRVRAIWGFMWSLAENGNHCFSKDQYSDLVFQEKMNNHSLNNVHSLPVVVDNCRNINVQRQYNCKSVWNCSWSLMRFSRQTNFEVTFNSQFYQWFSNRWSGTRAVSWITLGKSSGE